MAQLKRIARGAATVGVIAACELGTHYAASTPGAEGFGFAVVVAPLLLIALAAAARTPQRVWLLPLWACGCAALWLARAPLVRHFEWGAYLEHLSINLVMAFAFWPHACSRPPAALQPVRRGGPRHAHAGCGALHPADHGRLDGVLPGHRGRVDAAVRHGAAGCVVNLRQLHDAAAGRGDVRRGTCVAARGAAQRAALQHVRRGPRLPAYDAWPRRTRTMNPGFELRTASQCTAVRTRERLL